MAKMSGGTRAFSSIRILARPWNEEEKALCSGSGKDCCHIFGLAVVKKYVNADSEPLTQVSVQVAAFDFELVFRAHYSGIARVIVRVVRDPARAEELAAEVFWKLSRTPKAQGANTSGWLYRTASRMALDEL